MNTDALHVTACTSRQPRVTSASPPLRDALGVETSSGNPRSLDAYARALRAFHSYRGDPVAIIDEALDADPEFVMGHVLRAHVHVSLWERSVVSEVRAAVARLRALDRISNDREKQHVAALDHRAAGEWQDARATLDRLCAQYPRDLLALQCGHLSDFFHGDRDSLRGRIARAIEAFSRGDYAQAVACLLPVRYRAHAFGSSHAQRDVVHRTLIEAALRDGDKSLARALLNERASLRPQCPFTCQLSRRVAAT